MAVPMMNPHTSFFLGYMDRIKRKRETKVEVNQEVSRDPRPQLVLHEGWLDINLSDIFGVKDETKG